MNRTRDDLDRQVKAFYESYSIEAGMLERVKAAIGSTASDSVRRFRLSSRPLVLAVAAGLALAAGIGGLFIARPFFNPSTALAHQVASEIAANHRKQLRPEFVVQSFADLHDVMPQLDFSPVRPQRVLGAGYKLVGARYCSICKLIAVQIRLRDGAGQAYTLYEFRGHESLESIREQSLEIDGVRISIWREAGLIMGLAGPSS